MVKTLYEKTLSLFLLFMLMFSVGIMAQNTGWESTFGDEDGNCGVCGEDIFSCTCYDPTPTDCIECPYSCGQCNFDCGGTGSGFYDNKEIWFWEL